MNFDKHKSKKILITGGHGFVGKNLVGQLKELGANNLLVPSRSDVNLTIENEVKDYFKKNKPEIVIH